MGLFAIVFAGLMAMFIMLYFQAKTELARFESIKDLESHKTELESKNKKGAVKLKRLKQEIEETERHLEELRQDAAIVEEVALLRTEIASSETRLAEVRIEIGEFDELFTVRDQIDSTEAELAELRSQVELCEESLELQSFGFYQPRYGFESSERYQHHLDEVRARQKKLIKDDGATHCPADWTVDGSAAKGRKMIGEQSKLMLRAFNGEIDAAVGKVKYNNVTTLENRINKSFEAINKLGKSKQIWITREYLDAKLQELYLVHEHRVKVQEEKEEQQRIREQMREEEKAQKEIERAQKQAEKEEETAAKALEKARKELEATAGKQAAKMEELVERLEAELKDALEKKAKAIARAQLTRSGHVYVLSNIGSFGEGVFKIGMTRRLEPLDRVKELGDASVPFRFDVHAMIYSEDAPDLERTLHQHFASRRVNMINLRREYFHVTLDEIKEAIEEHYGVITMVTVPEADEYRQTLAKMDAEGWELAPHQAEQLAV